MKIANDKVTATVTASGQLQIQRAASNVTGIVSVASCVMLFATPRRQAVWDYVATTVVVRD